MIEISQNLNSDLEILRIVLNTRYGKYIYPNQDIILSQYLI